MTLPVPTVPVPQLVVVSLFIRPLSALMRTFKQPSVVAEMLGGLILGPSVLGSLIPGFTTTLFPCSSLKSFSLVANLGGWWYCQ
jgi:Kef-type K+ transport system membrane component KefB